ncbi:MAG: hypothetical protein WAQ27_02755 [Candidatus Microsaccharimonas sp.]
MSIDRAWGSHYSNGDLVLTNIDGEGALVVIIEHAGDCFHISFLVTIENNEDTPEGSDHLIGHPSTRFNNYWAGEKVGRLSTEQLFTLAGGIDVPSLGIDLDRDKPTGRVTIYSRQSAW